MCDRSAIESALAVLARPNNVTSRAQAFLGACQVSRSSDFERYMNLTWWSAAAASSCERVVRIGPHGEGGKSVCNAPALLEKEDCLVVSVGLNNDTSFETALHARFPGCSVHGYDGTLNEAKRRNLPPFMHFHPTNFHANTWEYFANNSRLVNVLKIDCEGCAL